MVVSEVFTKTVNRISVSPSAAHFLAHAFREYGGLFTGGQAFTENSFRSTTALTKTVSGVSS